MLPVSFFSGRTCIDRLKSRLNCKKVGTNCSMSVTIFAAVVCGVDKEEKEKGGEGEKNRLWKGRKVTSGIYTCMATVRYGRGWGQKGVIGK